MHDSSARTNKRKIAILSIAGFCLIAGVCLQLIASFSSYQPLMYQDAQLGLAYLDHWIQQYYENHNSLPKGIPEIKEQIRRGKFPFASIDDEVINNDIEAGVVDFWGEEYIYRPVDVEHGKYILLSMGRDKQEGTPDDIYYDQHYASRYQYEFYSEKLLQRILSTVLLLVGVLLVLGNLLYHELRKPRVNN